MNLNLFRNRLAVIGLMVALFAVVVMVGVVSVAQNTPTTFQPSIGAVAEGAADNPLATVYKSASPSVVSIAVRTEAGGGSGSGFVIDKAGHIVTNNHVVDDATYIEVEFFDGTLTRGEIVGLDPDADLAVIQVDLPGTQLFPVEFVDTDTVFVGQDVVAIGSPFGQEWTLTRGIISATDRTIQADTQFSIGSVIQTDTPINPGNSGGPLLDLNGRVIGVNSQILSGSGTNSGVGFAIPANLVQRVAFELIDTGRVDYSYIGISGGDVTLPLIEEFDLANNLRGVVVGNVIDGGPAALAGLQSVAGNQQAITAVDIITRIDDTPVYSMEDLISYLARETRPGDTVTLDVLRNGTETLTVDLTLASRDS